MAYGRVYWAAEADIQRLAPRCLERFAFHVGQLRASGRWDRMRSALSAYYGRGADGNRDAAQMFDTGDDGETTELHINAVRPAINNALSLIAGTRPEVKAKAINSDSKALAQTRLAQALHEYYDERTSAQTREVDCVRGGLLASSWSLGLAWQPGDGKEWAVDESGAPVYEGDVATFVLPPWRVVYDGAVNDDSQRRWTLFRRPLSRYDVAAQFREKGLDDIADRLCSVVQGDNTGTTRWREFFAQQRPLEVLLGEVKHEEDVVWVWELRHRPTPALPQGRLVRFVEPDIVLWDSMAQGVAYPYPDDDLLVYEYCPERTVTGEAGHTGAFDLLGGQEFLDLCTTSVATTVNINGQNRMWTPPAEGGVNPRSLGLNGVIIESPIKPEPLEYPAIKGEVLGAADWVLTQMRQAMALNNVVMGQPEKGMPASAQALQRAQAVQFHAVSQSEYLRLIKRHANGRLKLLKRFARSPRTAEIAGAARAYEVQEWQATDIEGVHSFSVEPVNPMAASFEGRQAMAETLGGMGKLSPEGYVAFLQTGNLEQGLDTERLRKELIETNVTLLQKGIGPPPVDIAASLQQGGPVFVEDGQQHIRLLKSDPHHIAVPAYLGVLASPSSREDAAIMQAATEAVQLSLQLWASLTPDEAAAFGIPPLPSQGMMGAPPTGAPPDAGAPEGPSPAGIDEAPPLPKPPENPLTGEDGTPEEVGLA